MKPTDIIDRDSLRDDIPEFRPGDTVKVHVRVVEGTRERVQVFQGAVIRRQGTGVQETFTVRKVSFGVGVVRRRPSGQAVLPARPPRQGGQDQGAADCPLLIVTCGCRRPATPRP